MPLYKMEMPGRSIEFLTFKWKVLLLMFTFGFVGHQAVSQSARINLGPDQIALNEFYTISLTMENENIRTYSGFPEIKGFKKRGTTSSTSTNIINGRMSYTQSIIQQYQATGEGTFKIDPFQVKVNTTVVSGPGGTVTVGPARQQQQRRSPFSFDPFDDFFDRPTREPEYLDVDADAFFAVLPDKESIYVGEGVNVTVAFYVGGDNKAEMQFFDLSNQLQEVLKKIKPQNVWEENFQIEEIRPETVQIGQKEYTRYKLYEANYYPLNEEPIRFPSAGMKMVKYQVAKNPTFFGRNRKQDFETFYSKPRIVQVKPLPPHPQKDRVAVGRYRLDEDISTSEAEAGGSISYSYTIQGEGNIANLPAPTVREGDGLEIYTPDIRQDIFRGNGKVTGTKVFDYYIMPNEPGNYDLGNYFSWIYFDPVRARYDTLISRATVKVTGASQKNLSIESNGLGSFYDRIEFTSNELRSFDQFDWVRWSVNIILVLVAAGTVYLIVKRK